MYTYFWFSLHIFAYTIYVISSIHIMKDQVLSTCHDLFVLLHVGACLECLVGPDDPLDGSCASTHQPWPGRPKAEDCRNLHIQRNFFESQGIKSVFTYIYIYNEILVYLKGNQKCQSNIYIYTHIHVTPYFEQINRSSRL